MNTEITVKPFLEYDALVQKLTERGMHISDPLRAQRKLTQVGYYHLSGYWHTSRRFSKTGGKITYNNEFQPGTSFEAIFNFYLFDKCLRLEISDALERIEIYLRTIFAHEIGRISPLAYLDIKQFSRKASKEGSRLRYSDWISRHNDLIKKSKEDSITNHIKNRKPIPIWVAAEAWDFGALSKFYSILSGKNQDLICSRLGLDNRKALDNWLINLNGIRNRCAHHSRMCNRRTPRTILIPQKGYFNLLDLNEDQKNKLIGVISLIWFLLKQIGPNSKWIHRIADLIDKKPNIPGFTYSSMGIKQEFFPRALFPETVKERLIKKTPLDELEEAIKKIPSIVENNDFSKIELEERKRIETLIDALTHNSYKLDEYIGKT